MRKDGVSEISLYTKIAISLRDYNAARRCIFVNIDNEGITKEQKSNLLNMTRWIDRAIGREKAVNILSANPNANMIKLMEDTKLSEIELIQIRKNLTSGTATPEIREKLPFED